MALRFIQTCSACPEQYDVYDGAELVGYMRLRHGIFQARHGGPDGPVVYEAQPYGEGVFEDWEREGHLEEALAAIAALRNEEKS